jgi:HAD superfamily hydrolase (TIGR01509 family)
MQHDQTHGRGALRCRRLTNCCPAIANATTMPGYGPRIAPSYSAYWSRRRPLRHAAELLRACKERGLRVVLASSADEREFAVLRAALDAEDAIDEATSSADVERSKPAADLVQVALDRAGVSAAEAVFVGDTVWDVQACQQAGVRCIGLLSGGIGRNELIGPGAAQVLDGPAELLAALSDSLLGRQPEQTTARMPATQRAGRDRSRPACCVQAVRVMPCAGT